MKIRPSDRHHRSVFGEAAGTAGEAGSSENEVCPSEDELDQASGRRLVRADCSLHAAIRNRAVKAPEFPSGTTPQTGEGAISTPNAGSA